MEENDNHSIGYSMLGYICAYMRHYYPLEFCCAYLNCSESLTDIYDGTMLIKEKGFNLLPPRFRKSKNVFMIDKATNSIYKGLTSIKDISKVAGEYLYSVKDNKYDNFLQLYNSTPKKMVDKSQFEILIKINFFEEFGGINELLAQIETYKKYGTCKQFNINKLSDEEIALIKPCANTITKSLLKDLDNYKLMNAYYKSLNIKPASETLKLHYELKLLGYTDIIIPSSTYYGVTQIEKNQYGTPFITLYEISTGHSMQYKCNKKHFNSLPCEQGDVLNVIFEEKEKRRKVADENGKEEWVGTGEFETMIKLYSVKNG